MRILMILLIGLLPTTSTRAQQAIYTPQEWYPMWVPYPIRMIDTGMFYAVENKWEARRDGTSGPPEDLVFIRGIDVPIPRRQTYPTHDCRFARDHSSKIIKYLRELIGKNQPLRLLDIEGIDDIPGYPTYIGYSADVYANGINVAEQMIADGMAKPLKPGQPRYDWCDGHDRY